MDETTATGTAQTASKRLLDDQFVLQAISRSAENRTDRRRFLRSAGLAGFGLATAGVASAVGVGSAAAADNGAATDAAVLNFALNLEYLEANFYMYAVYGHGIPDNMVNGSGRLGAVTGGRKVNFTSLAIKELAQEIARDELHHVEFLRKALGGAKVSQPAINIRQSFTAAAVAAGVIPAGKTFDPYANQEDFLLGAFVFEDVGVTAYKGAAPLISNKTYLSAAAGILAVEAYHASAIRTRIYDLGLSSVANKIDAARNFLGGPHTPHDIGVTNHAGVENIVPADGNGVAFGRTPGQVLNIVYLNPKAANSGGFFPHGVNGTFHTSG